MAKTKDISASFSRKVLAAARRFVVAYDIVLHREGGEWYGHALEYPEAMGDGKTPAACINATQKALIAGIATMIEAGDTPPAPARQGVRSVQVNVRLTHEEKLILETAAGQKGFRGVSDLMRTGALELAKA